MVSVTRRRFPPPWTIEDIGAAFVVKDSGGQQPAYVYYEEQPGYSYEEQPGYSAKMELGGSRRQAVSLSSWLQCGHRKTRISVSPPGPGTTAIKFISAHNGNQLAPLNPPLAGARTLT
jgi:hypothetical protein